AFVDVKRAVLYLRVSTLDQTTANRERELREIAGRGSEPPNFDRTIYRCLRSSSGGEAPILPNYSPEGRVGRFRRCCRVVHDKARMEETVTTSTSEAIASRATASEATRWGQLIFGIICMVMIANLQYGWTLFVNPIDQKYHWGRAAIQVAFTIF